MSSYPCTLHFSSSCDGVLREWSGERGEHRVAHEQVNWDSVSISVLPSMDSAGFPVALSVASVPQILQMYEHYENAETYFNTNRHTVLISQQTNCSMSSAHERFVHCIWFKEKCFLECLCMNLNFKLFSFFY